MSVAAVREWAMRVRAALFGARMDRALDEDISAHLSELADEFRKNGMSDAEAERAARREFGGVARIQEAYRAQSGLPFVDTLIQDLHYAVRMCRRQRGFTAAIVLSRSVNPGETTKLDHVPRQIVFQRVPHTPLLIVIGSARQPLIASWRRFAIPAFGGALLLGAMWFWLSRAFARGHARQEQLLAELREQSQRGEEARRIAKLGDWTWNLETGEVFWSPEIFAICGVPQRIGPLRIEEIPDRMHPDDRERMRGYLGRATGGGELNETQYRIVRPDGEVRWVYARAEWVDRTPGRRFLDLMIAYLEHEGY